MVETIANFPAVKMEVFAGHTPIRIQPVLGIAPEALDAMDMVAPHGLAFLLADHHMLTPQFQSGVSLPLVGVVQRALAGMGLDVAHHLRPAMGGDRHRLDLTVTFDDAKHDYFTGRTPAPFAVQARISR